MRRTFWRHISNLCVSFFCQIWVANINRNRQKVETWQTSSTYDDRRCLYSFLYSLCVCGKLNRGWFIWLHNQERGIENHPHSHIQWTPLATFLGSKAPQNYTVQIQHKGSLLAWMVPWRTFNIHGIFPLHKRFFTVEKGSSDYALHTKKKWFFNGIALKTRFGTLMFKSVWNGIH